MFVFALHGATKKSGDNAKPTLAMAPFAHECSLGFPSKRAMSTVPWFSTSGSVQQKLQNFVLERTKTFKTSDCTLLPSNFFFPFFFRRGGGPHPAPTSLCLTATHAAPTAEPCRLTVSCFRSAAGGAAATAEPCRRSVSQKAFNPRGGGGAAPARRWRLFATGGAARSPT